MLHRIISEDFDQIAKNNLPLKKFAGKTILISGASGMIGGYLTELFLYLNDTQNFKTKIIALTRNEYKTKKRYQHYAKRRDLSLIIQDITVPLTIKGQVECIIHAASQSSPKYFGADPVGTILPNVIGTKNLLEIARQKKSEDFLFISSGEVYGSLKESQIPVEETDYGFVDPMNIRSCYAESKRMGETMCVSWQAQHKVPIKIARPFHVYGPGIDLDDGRIFADFTRAIVKKQNLIITSDGSARRSFCYLSDAITAFLTIILRGGVGEAYNVGNSNEEVSIKELAYKLIKTFPERNLKIVFKPKNITKGYLPSRITRSYPDITKIKKLGWNPIHTIESGFKRTFLSFS
jgi:nucleoside-diphosphate-sugar epimerase